MTSTRQLIDIITDADFLSDSAADAVGFLFECAPDSQIAVHYKNCVFVSQLLGEQDHNKKMACDLAKKILHNEPRIRDIPQLAILKEEIITKLTEFFQLIHLYDFLMMGNYAVCRFRTYSRSAKIFSDICKMRGGINVIYSSQSKENKFFKRARLFCASIFSWDELLQHANWILNFFDPFHRRTLCFSFFKKRNKYNKNKLWFLSFAKNYTNIALLYEPLFPENFHFLVEDSLTGGNPLKQKKRLFFNIYEFGCAKLIPSQSEIALSREKIVNHITSVFLQGSEAIVRLLFLKSAWLQYFFLKRLSVGLYITSLTQNWIMQTTPSALIVGNNGHEQYALLTAKEKNIPTLLLQHGVFGDYYQFEDSPVDHYIARGEFWRNFLLPAARERALIINSPMQNKSTQVNLTKTKHSKKPFVVYFSLLHPNVEKKNRFCEERDSQLLSIAKEIIAANAKLIIRFHPRDHIALHRKHVKNLYKNNKIDIDVHYSYKENIPELLNGASAAIMYFSTVFMDCLSLGVPIISYDWLSFPHKKNIEPYHIFNFAENLFQLRALIKKALTAELLPAHIDKKLFLAETTEVEARKVLHQLI